MQGLTDELRAEYDGLFGNCVVDRGNPDSHRPDRLPAVKNFTKHVMTGIARYQDVEAKTDVPWYVIGVIHGMECGFDFETHLHNGDSLKHRTVQEPKGRPMTGTPPFSFLISAIDALQYDRFTSWKDWSVAGICYKLESYNGWGYRSHHINSPYLWSFSNQYKHGKYVSDGHWDPDAVSKQVGAVVALKQLVDDQLIALLAQPV